jgi:separase
LPSVESLKIVSDSIIDVVKHSTTTKPASTAKKQKAPVKETRSRNPRTIQKDVDIASIMSKAKVAIGETVRNAAAFGSTIEGHAAAGLMGRISMLLHATTPGLVDQDILTPANGK